MSTTVAIRNCGVRPFAMKLMGTLAADPAVVKTAVFKQVVADDASINFDNAAKFGVQISEDGVARPGSEVVTATGNLDAASNLAIVDMGASIVLTLPTLASVPDGHMVTVYLRTATAGTLTVDGNGAETVLGQATQTATTAGYLLRIMKKASVSTTDWVAQAL